MTSNNTKTYTVRVCCDCPEIDQYVDWLNDHGHNAERGRTTADEIDGNSAFSDETAREISERLWSEYCNS